MKTRATVAVISMFFATGAVGTAYGVAPAVATLSAMVFALVVVTVPRSAP